MKPSVIGLKCKDTDKVDWKRGLSSYLKRIYGSRQWKEFYDEQLCVEMDHVRNNANGELGAVTLVEQNYKYYAYLEQLYLRLGNNIGQFKLEFTWYDAEYGLVSSPTKHTQKTLVFEKSCTLYNLGVALTEVANEKINEDFKTAMVHMAKAMECFRYLSENFFNSPSADLQTENTKFLSDLSHAEAQEMFLINAINNGTSEKQASLISKLAYSGSNLYENCWEFLRTEEGGLTPYGEARWNSIVSGKHHFFRSLAAYYNALALEQNNKYGEAIAFLKLATQCLSSSLPYKYALNDNFDFDGFGETIKDKTKQLIKDNDYIFHDSIPQSVSLSSIKALDAIKAPKWEEQLKPFMESIAHKCEKLYRGIVPMEVFEKESIYSEKKASMLRQCINDSETADMEYSSFIEFTHLPNLLSDLKRRYKSQNFSGTTDPQGDMMRDQIQSWIKSISQSKYKDPDEQLKLVSSKKQEILTLLAGLPSEQKENVVKLKMALVEAAASDEKLFSLVQPYAAQLRLLKQPDELWKIFNMFSIDESNKQSLLDIDDSKNQEILAKIYDIEQMAEDLRLLKEERGRTLKELKSQTNDDDITNTLLVNSKAESEELEVIFKKELDKFKPLTTRIEATIFKQESVVNEVKNELDNVFSLSGLENKTSEEEEKQKKRKEFFMQIEEAATKFLIFNNDLPKGLEFYDSLLKMSKDLAVSVKVQNNASGSDNNSNNGYVSGNVIPPPLPPQPRNVGSSIDSQFQSMNLGSVPTPQRFPQPPAPSSRLIVSMENYTSQFSVPPAHSDLPPAYNQVPLVPTRNYDQPHGSGNYPGNVSSQHPVSSSPIPGAYDQVPMVPPKQPPAEGRSQISRQEQMEREERELQRDPTAFYKKSSVFDESLYSRYSGK